MDFQRYITLALFGLAFLAPIQARAECECPADSVVEGIRKADRIFHGKVVSATMREDDSQTIEFVVAVHEVIRGTTDKQYNLTTALPNSCGVAVRLGFHDLFVLQPGELRVSSCTGSGRAPGMKYPLLAAAIALVDLPVSDVSTAVQLLNKQFYSSFDRATVDEFFKLVEMIDPMGSDVTGMADRVEYRGIVVYFKDGRYERVGAF